MKNIGILIQKEKYISHAVFDIAKTICYKGFFVQFILVDLCRYFIYLFLNYVKMRWEKKYKWKK